MIGHIQYKGDPQGAFSVDLIEQIEVKEWLSDTMEMCDHWGWHGGQGDDRYDFGSIGRAPNIVYEIYDEYTKFFIGDPQWIQFNEDAGHLELVDYPMSLGSIKLELRWYYKRPVTMGDFIGCIVDFHKRLHKLADPVYEMALPF